MDFFEIKDKVVGEIGNVLSTIKKKEVKRLVEALLSAEKVFVAGAGRTMLMMEAFAKRLNHLKVDVHVVGEIIEPPATKKDLLIVASGSGESTIPLEVAKTTKKIGTQVALITARKESRIARIADIVVCIPAPTKLGPSKEAKSFQPLGNLFEQSLLLFCDVVAMFVQKRQGLSNRDLLKHHANLE